MKNNNGKVSIKDFFAGFLLIVIIILGLSYIKEKDNSKKQVEPSVINPVIYEEEKIENETKIEIENKIEDENDLYEESISIIKPSKKISKLLKNDEEAEYYVNNSDNVEEFYLQEILTGDAIWSGLSTKYKASSVHSKDTATYDANNMNNLFTENCWCEGVTGNGIGEKIEIDAFATCEKVNYSTNKEAESAEEVAKYLLSDFNNEPAKGETQIINEDNINNYKSEINQIAIINGNAKSDTLWKNNGRVKKLKLTIDNEECYILELDDCKDLQIFDINYTNKSIAENMNLEFEVLEVYSGEKYDDTCLTSLYLLGGSNVKWGGR